MLAKRPRSKMVPVHSSAFAFADYLPYLRPGAPADRAADLERVWAPIVDRPLVPTPTGRHALWYFLDLVDLPRGSHVLIAGYNYYVIVQLVVQNGLIPIFVDIDPETLCMDAADLEAKATAESKLVIVTHMLGNPADLGAIVDVCTRRGLLLFEDCAHAVGSVCDSGSIGAAGDGALYTFGPEKIVNSFGGGMLALSEELAARPRSFAHEVSVLTAFGDTFVRFLYSLMLTPGFYGAVARPLLDVAFSIMGRADAQVKSLIAAAPGYVFDVNTRAPFKPFMIAMHRLQLARLGANVARRREIAATVKARLARLPGVTVLREDKHGRSNVSYFAIYVPEPRALAAHLKQHGVESNPELYQDCSDYDAFRRFSNHCAASARAAAHILRLPNYPAMADEDVDHLACAIESYFAR